MTLARHRRRHQSKPEHCIPINGRLRPANGGAVCLAAMPGRCNHRHQLFGHSYSGRYKALNVDGKQPRLPQERLRQARHVGRSLCGTARIGAGAGRPRSPLTTRRHSVRNASRRRRLEEPGKEKAFKMNEGGRPDARRSGAAIRWTQRALNGSRKSFYSNPSTWLTTLIGAAAL